MKGKAFWCGDSAEEPPRFATALHGRHGQTLGNCMQQQQIAKGRQIKG